MPSPIITPIPVTLAETNNENYVGGTQDWFATTVYFGTVTAAQFVVIVNSTVYATLTAVSASFNTNLAFGYSTIVVTASYISGGKGYSGTNNKTVFISASNIINQIGNVTPASLFTVYHNGTVIPAFNNQTNRNISVASGFSFQTPSTYGASIALGDRIEFGYHGHPAFYGWTYSIDKSSANIYTITAYDGGYGLAQAASSQGDIDPSSAFLTIGDLFENIAYQVGGFGASGTEQCGINFPFGVLPQVFGWGFSQGQVLQKLEAVSLGYGYIEYTDYFSNLMLSNYEVTCLVGTVVIDVIPVGNISLRENTDSFVVNNKLFDPSTEYGFWEVIGTYNGGSEIAYIDGGGIPSRQLGAGWLLVTSTTEAQLVELPTTYFDIFMDGIWTVTAWTNRWFDTSGVDIGGSIGAYIGDGNYLFTTIPNVGMVITPMSTGTPIATLTVTGMTNPVYVRNSESPQVCSVVGSAIQKVGGFMVNLATVVGTIGSGGTLTGKSVSYDGLDTLFTATPGGILYETNWYTSASSVIATIGGTVTFLLAATIGAAYIGKTNGVVYSETLGTVTGTGGYNVQWLFLDSTNENVYVCAGGTTVPYFANGGSSVLGTLSVTGTGAVAMGVATNVNNLVFFAGSTVVEGVTVGGTVAPIFATVPAGWTITAMNWDSAYGFVLVTVVGTGGTQVFEYDDTLTIQGTIVVSTVSATMARTIDESVTRQNLYTLYLADGTTLYNCIVSNVQIQQNGVTLTFKSNATTAGAQFVGPPDTTQLALWNVLATPTSGA